MKLHRLLIGVSLVGALLAAAYLGQTAEAPAIKMATAADRFLESLSPEQKAKACFDFEDKERTNWHFVPLQKDGKPLRKGLRLADMDDKQRAAAMELVRAGTSAEGYTKASTIMSLESILNDLEKGGGLVRNPGWYFFSVFGKPSKTGKWGWRVEGHHLSLNLTLEGDKIIGATPAFYGANPATVKDGKRKGLRTLPGAEDLALELFQALDDDQKQVAQQKKQFADIEEGKSAPHVGDPVGLTVARMKDRQRDLLLKLLEDYTSRMPEDIAGSEMKQLKEAGVDKIHFAFAGAAKEGVPHSYRIQGPTFVVEFLNVQADSARNPANHIHSCWRNLKGDFGQAVQ